MTRLIKIVLFIAILSQLASCYEPRSTYTRGPKISTIGSVEKLNAKVKVFNTGDDSTRFYFELNTRPQDYYFLSDKSKLKAEYKLNFELFRTDPGKKTKVDSASLKLVDLQLTAGAKKIKAYFDCKAEKNALFAISVSIVNANNNAGYSTYLKFSKRNCVDPENYVIMNDQGQPLMERNLPESSGQVFVSKMCTERVRLLKIIGAIEYPKPPFANDDFASENNYKSEEVTLNPSGQYGFTFGNLEKGAYTLQTSPTSGIMFYHFNSWYPYSKDTSGFYEPLIYITSQDEFRELQNSANSKDKFEEFWLTRAGTKAAARKCINEYYKRVFEANTDYTSVTEGWRTDRGMIYIVFGKPTYTEKQLNKEIWIYRTAFNATLSFSFFKVDNPYSDNDYHLERENIYKPQWYNALENWRGGRPFTLTGH